MNAAPMLGSAPRFYLSATPFTRSHVPRKQRAANLERMLERGHAYAYPGAQMVTREQAEADFARWLREWILPEVRDLIPELKEPKK